MKKGVKIVLWTLGIMLGIVVVAIALVFAIPSTRTMILDLFSTPEGTPVQLSAEYTQALSDPNAVQQRLDSSAIVKAIPEEGAIQLRVGATSYILSGGLAVLGTLESPDVILYLPASYEKKIMSEDVCDVIRDGSRSGKLLVEYHASKASLGWKYRALQDYASCL